MPDTNPSAVSGSAAESNRPEPARPAGAKIHRVCIGCNNMFEVSMENYELKHCPVCRKQ
jgi:hypothetical protein